jgi:hypothetical protein
MRQVRPSDEDSASHRRHVGSEFGGLCEAGRTCIEASGADVQANRARGTIDREAGTEACCRSRS